MKSSFSNANATAGPMREIGRNAKLFLLAKDDDDELSGDSCFDETFANNAVACDFALIESLQLLST